MSQRIRTTIRVTQEIVLDGDLDEIVKAYCEEGDTLTLEQVEEHIDQAISDGDGEGILRGGSEFGDKAMHDDWSVVVEVHRYCDVHPEAVIEGIFKNDGVPCCYKCWQDPARVAEEVDAGGLNPPAERREGSSPSPGIAVEGVTDRERAFHRGGR